MDRETACSREKKKKEDTHSAHATLALELTGMLTCKKGQLKMFVMRGMKAKVRGKEEEKRQKRGRKTGRQAGRRKERMRIKE